MSRYERMVKIGDEVREIISTIPRAYMRAKRDGKTVMCGSYAGTEAAKQEIRQALEAAGFTVTANPVAHPDFPAAADLLVVTRP